VADVRGDELELLVGGARYTGWERLEVVRSLEAASGAFVVEVADRGPLAVRAGQEVTVRLAGAVVVRGHVDAVEARGDARRRSFTVSGRDRTADLVDCSELSEPGEWFDVGLLELLNLIAAPFEVEVESRLEETPDPFARFARQPGESAWSAVERACRLRGVLVHSSGDGRLLLERPGRGLAGVALREGRNVLSWAVSTDLRQRFSSYVVRAQSPGSDDFYADQAALVEAESADPAVGRFRPLLVLAEGALVFENARDRANWEATVRAARSERTVVTVQGWRQAPDAPLWDLNQLVHVVLPALELDQVLLVQELRFARDLEQGTTTTIGLTRRDAYDPQPEVDERDQLEYGEGD